MVAVGYLAFRTGVDYSAYFIWSQPEYGHGLLIPFIAAFLVWQKRDEIERLPFRGSWIGVSIVILGIAINLIGKMASLYIIQQYSAVVAL